MLGAISLRSRMFSLGFQKLQETLGLQACLLQMWSSTWISLKRLFLRCSHKVFAAMNHGNAWTRMDMHENAWYPGQTWFILYIWILQFLSAFKFLFIFILTYIHACIYAYMYTVRSPGLSMPCSVTCSANSHFALDLPDWNESKHSTLPRFEHSAVPWFLQTFTKEEQKTWAVADVHWYVAWSSGDCDGRSVTCLIWWNDRLNMFEQVWGLWNDPLRSLLFESWSWCSHNSNIRKLQTQTLPGHQVEGGGFHCAAPMPQVKAWPFELGSLEKETEVKVILESRDLVWESMLNISQRFS